MMTMLPTPDDTDRCLLIERMGRYLLWGFWATAFLTSVVSCYLRSEIVWLPF